VPIITSNTSSMPEIVADAALICDPFDANSIADAIITLYNNMELQQRFIAKSLNRSELFSWKENAVQTIKIYESV